MSTLSGRLRADWMAVTGTGATAGVSLAVLVLASVFVAVAGARVSQTVPTSALRAGLRMVPTSDKAVLGGAGFGDSGMGDSGPLPAAQLSSYRMQLRGNLSQRLPLAPAATDWTGLTTGYSTVLAGGRRAWDGSTPPQLELAYRDGLSRYTKHITGSLPTVSRGHEFQVAVTTATARRFGVTVGSRLRLTPSLTLVVTGIIVRPGRARRSGPSTLRSARPPSTCRSGRRRTGWVRCSWDRARCSRSRAAWTPARSGCPGDSRWS